MAQRPGPYPKTLAVKVSFALYSALEAEAWEEQLTLSDYVRALLTRRGKWARTVGTAGGYDLATPARPKRDE
jgi:hypothetical protein